MALEDVGLHVSAIPIAAPIDLRDFDGLVLPGGTDVDPTRYGQRREASTQPPDSERDDFETELATAAFLMQIPLLAICRGMQLVNVMHGGTLLQDIPTRALHLHLCSDHAIGFHPSAHTVLVQPNTLLESIVQHSSISVNSRHHQAIGEIGKTCFASATSSDGIIEAIETPEHPDFLGIQWHPEDRYAASIEDKRIFEWFAAAARRRSTGAGSIRVTSEQASEWD